MNAVGQDEGATDPRFTPRRVEFFSPQRPVSGSTVFVLPAEITGPMLAVAVPMADGRSRSTS